MIPPVPFSIMEYEHIFNYSKAMVFRTHLIGRAQNALT